LVALLSADRSALGSEQNDRLVLLVDPGVPTLARRLREEVEALGLEVRTVPAVEPDVPLEDRARSAGAIAAIRITTSGTGSVEMTIVDRATGKTVKRTLALTTAQDPASTELIATRTVELLRASLIELAAEHPPRGEVTLPPEVAETVTRELDDGAPAFSLGAAPAVGFATEAPASANVELTLSLRTHSGFGAGVAALVPLGVSHVRVPEGDIELAATILRLGALYETAPSDVGFSLRALVGGELALLSVEGIVSTPYVGSDEHLVGGGPWVGADFLYAATSQLRVFVGADAGATFPQLVLRSAGREVLAWGRVVGSVGAGLEVTW
jgi:hypothetical protein